MSFDFLTGQTALAHRPRGPAVSWACRVKPGRCGRCASRRLTRQLGFWSINHRKITRISVENVKNFR